MAEAYGRRLLDEVEVVGLNEIVSSIRSRHNESPTWFSCVQFDNILRTIYQHNHALDPHRPPLVEITSIAPQGGKTHLLYLLTAIAITPSEYGGRAACVAIIDADASFDVHRLIQQIRLRIESRTSNLSTTESQDVIRSALDHAYILKPQGSVDVVKTIKGLPDWFLHQQHKSLARPMAFFAVDSINALDFINSSDKASQYPGSTASSASYAELMAALSTSSRVLQCPAVLATRFQGRLPKAYDDAIPRTLRPDLASPQHITLRLIVRRIPVRSVPTGLSDEEAARETAQRLQVVALGRFECVVNEHGLNAQTVKALYAAEDGFFFHIRQEGLIVDSTRDSV